MGKGVNKPDDEIAGGHESGEASAAGLTTERYATELELPVAWVKNCGLVTIDNPWSPNRKAVSIRYRRRNGAWFRDRIRQASEPRNGRQFRSLWDKRDEKLGAMLYGLDGLPAKGCSLFLVCDEAPCHILRFHGFDAVATQGAEGYFPKRDDPELDGFEIAVFAPLDAEFLTRLSRSQHWRRIKVATLEGFVDIIDLHKRGRGQFADIVNAALSKAVPLVGDAKGEKSSDTRSRDGGSSFDGTIVDTSSRLLIAMESFFPVRMARPGRMCGSMDGERRGTCARRAFETGWCMPTIGSPVEHQAPIL